MFVSPKVLFAFSTLVVAALGVPTRITGGVNAPTGSAPWAASIQVGLFSPTHVCGGNIITNRNILTSGHCGHNLIGSLTGIITQYTNARVGSMYLSSGGTRYLLTSGSVHPEFHEATGYANLAILTTTLPMTINNQVYPVRLNMQAPPIDATATVAGWGALSVGGLNSERLQSLATTTMSFSECTTKAQEQAQAQGINIPAIYEQREVCAFHSVGAGNCNGDQGNGLVDQNGFLIGVLSWAFPCGSGGPEVYSRSDFFAPWILSVVN